MAKQKKATEPEQEWAEEDQEEEEWPEESGTVSGVLMMPLFVGSVEEASDGVVCIGCLILVLPAQCWLSRTRSATSEVSRGRDVSGRYLAANGTPVQMGENSLGICFVRC